MGAADADAAARGARARDGVTCGAVERLPEWERGTPAVLCAAGPHAIPISTAVRVADDTIRFALGREREMLRRLREDERAALLVMGKGLAFSAYGAATVVAEQLEAADTVVAVELRVERVQDHLADGRTDMVDGARWRWTDESLAESEPRIWEELERL
jgi:Pyridoxamine 5'-phosphate oxidase